MSNNRFPVFSYSCEENLSAFQAIRFLRSVDPVSVTWHAARFDGYLAVANVKKRRSPALAETVPRSMFSTVFPAESVHFT